MMRCTSFVHRYLSCRQVWCCVMQCGAGCCRVLQCVAAGIACSLSLLGGKHESCALLYAMWRGVVRCDAV